MIPVQLQLAANPVYFGFDVALIVTFHQLASLGDQRESHIDLSETA